MFKIQIAILAVVCVLTSSTQAATIRNSGDDEKATTEVTTVTTTREEMDVTTVQADGADATTITPESELVAFSKDEAASLLIIDQTLLDSTSADLKQSDAETVPVQRSGKLLLLSTPKLGEKSKVVEESLEESEELKEELEAEQTTSDITLETTTVADSNDMEEETTISALNDDNNKSVEVPQEAVPTTKLFPINDTLYEGNMKTMGLNDQETLVVVDEEPKEMKNSNLIAIAFEEADDDYVLVESDLVEEGPYADIDSDLHLQPIVQSVEIVPSSVDDTLLVNYVHPSW